MIDAFEVVSPTDKTALLALSTPDWTEIAKSALLEQGYKVLAVHTHEEFATRFHQVHFQVVVVEELFAGTPPDQNATLQALQQMPMSMRRHAVVVLIGESLATLNTMQAYQLSVHAVVNYSDMPMLGHIIQKSVAENDLLFHTFRETQKRIVQSQG